MHTVLFGNVLLEDFLGILCMQIRGRHVLDTEDQAARAEHIAQCKARHDRVKARQVCD